MAPRRNSDVLKRLLAAMEWILANPESTVDELSERFGFRRAELTSLLGVLPFCGAPPYTPDQLIELDLEGDQVSLRMAPWYSNPLKMTRVEALELLATAQAVVSTGLVNQDSALASGLAKLRNALGIASEGLVVNPLPVSSEQLDDLRRSIDAHLVVHLEYEGPGGEPSSRDVEPGQLFYDGAWYLRSWCRMVDSERQFRLDRIRAYEITDQFFEPRELTNSTSAFTARPDLDRVSLRLSRAARWVCDAYEVESVIELDDGACEVQLAVSSVDWLRSLLLRLGDSALLVSHDGKLRGDELAGLAASMAAKYRQPATPSG